MTMPDMEIRAEYTGTEPNLRPAASAFARMIKNITNADGTFADPDLEAEFQAWTQKRLDRLKGNKISLLAKYNYTEEMAMAKCKEYNLVSPIYNDSMRGGCFFCMNTKISDFAKFKNKHSDLWNELLKLGQTPNLCSYGFKYGQTIEQVDAKVNAINSQLKLF